MGKSSSFFRFWKLWILLFAGGFFHFEKWRQWVNIGVYIVDSWWFKHWFSTRIHENHRGLQPQLGSLLETGTLANQSFGFAGENAAWKMFVATGDSWRLEETWDFLVIFFAANTGESHQELSDVTWQWRCCAFTWVSRQTPKKINGLGWSLIYQQGL